MRALRDGDDSAGNVGGHPASRDYRQISSWTATRLVEPCKHIDGAVHSSVIGPLPRFNAPRF